MNDRPLGQGETLRLLNGLKQLVPQLLFRVVNRQVEHVEACVSYRQIWVARRHSLNDNLKRLVHAISTRQNLTRIRSYFDGFHSEDWNAIRAGQEQQKPFLLLVVQIVEHLPEESNRRMIRAEPVFILARLLKRVPVVVFVSCNKYILLAKNIGKNRLSHHTNN